MAHTTTVGVVSGGVFSVGLLSTGHIALGLFAWGSYAFFKQVSLLLECPVLTELVFVYASVSVFGPLLSYTLTLLHTIVKSFCA
jgi:hypothetical protein